MRSEIEVENGTRAIEVAAMFEEAVVEVRHLTDSSPRGVTPATRALLAGGLVSLGAALGTFALAATRVLSFERSGAGLDACMVAAFAAGAYALLHGLLRRAAERAPRDFTIPAGLTGGPAAASFPLVHADGGRHLLVFTPQMRGEVTLDGVTIALADLAGRGLAHPIAAQPGAHAWPIATGASARVTLGEVTYLVSSVLPPRRHESAFKLDWGQQSYTAGVAVATGLFLAMIYSIPPDPRSLAIDDFMKNNRYPTFIVKAPLEEEKIPEWLNKKSDGPGGDAGGAAMGEGGVMGKEGAPREKKKYTLKGPADNVDVRIAKQLAVDAAQKAGVLGIMRATEGSHIASVWGRDSALGRDADNVMGGILGTEVGESAGVPGGLGIFGTRKGGGGTQEGIGVGKLPTIGHDGDRPGYGDPRRVASLPRDKKKNAEIENPSPPNIKLRGGLDKEIVRRVIRRHLNEVKFCYEKELMKNADLYGRVMTEFTISGNGQVLASAVQSSSLNNAVVEQCIAQAVRRWEFPKPDGGGIVVVAYPFVLKNAGSAN
jgi:hypothetical protein